MGNCSILLFYLIGPGMIDKSVREQSSFGMVRVGAARDALSVVPQDRARAARQIHRLLRAVACKNLRALGKRCAINALRQIVPFDHQKQHLPPARLPEARAGILLGPAAQTLHRAVDDQRRLRLDRVAAGFPNRVRRRHNREHIVSFASSARQQPYSAGPSRCSP